MSGKEKASESPSSPIAEYLRTASEQVRWRQARPALAAELESHLLDQAEAYRSAGMPADEAEAEAVRQMGDPVAVGQALDAVHRPAPQWVALGLVAAMAVAGAVAQLYCNVYLDAWWVDSTKVPAFTLMGVLLMAALHLLDCQAFLARHAIPVVAVAVGSACLVAAVSDFGAHSAPLAHSFHSVTLVFPFLLALLINRLRGLGWKGFAACSAATVPMALLAAFFGEVPQLLIMMVSTVFLVAYASELDWFGVSRLRGLLALAVCVAVASALLAATVTLEEHTDWASSLGALGQTPFGRYFTLSLGGVTVGSIEWFGGPVLSVVEGSVAEQVVGGYLAISPFDGMPVVLAMVLGLAPVALFYVGSLLMAGWLAVRSARQPNRLYAMLGASVSLIIVGETLFSLAPFLFGLTLSSSLLPFLTPGFHNVVLMSLVGIVLSGLRCENAPRALEAKPVRAGR